MKTIFVVFLLSIASINARKVMDSKGQDFNDWFDEELVSPGTEEWSESKRDETVVPVKGDVYGFTTIRGAERVDDNVKGSLEFVYDHQRKCMHIRGLIEGLSPGLHGMHIHEFGDGSSREENQEENRCMATGGHYYNEKSDIGDLGNIKAGDDGIAHVDICNKNVHTIYSTSVIGRSVVVHAGPNGKAGRRVGCGVIAMASFNRLKFAKQR